MRTLEIRSHAHRNMSQPHLSQQGVDLARRAGNELGRFDLVITSTVPRAFETAVIVEASAVGCLPASTRFADDAPCGYCEGVRLTLDNGAVISVEMLRADQPR